MLVITPQNGAFKMDAWLLHQIGDGAQLTTHDSVEEHAYYVIVTRETVVPVKACAVSHPNR